MIIFPLFFQTLLKIELPLNYYTFLVPIFTIGRKNKVYKIKMFYIVYHIRLR